MHRKLSIFAAALGLLLAVLLAQSFALAADVSIAVDEEWTAGATVLHHIVDGDLIVEEGATLTIGPGVIVKFDHGHKMIVKGTLNAEGLGSDGLPSKYAKGRLSHKFLGASKSATPVKFTYYLPTSDPMPTPRRNHWGGIVFMGGSTNNSMTDCLVEYAVNGVTFASDANGLSAGQVVDSEIQQCAQTGITVAAVTPGPGIAPTLGSNRIHDCGGPAILLGSNAMPDFTPDATKASTYNNCPYPNETTPTPRTVGFNGVTFGGEPVGDYHIDQFYNPPTYAGPYFVDGNLVVDAAGWLTLNAGTQMLFGQHGQLKVYGKLSAVGEASSRITFTSADRIGYVSPGDWAGIYFQDPGSNASELNYCDVVYAGADWGAVSVNNAKPRITNVTIDKAKNSGIWLAFGAAPTLTNPTITNCGDAAIWVGVASWPTFVGTSTYTNNGYNGTDLSSNLTTWPEGALVVSGSQKLFLQGSPYRCRYIWLYSGNTLTIEAGVKMEFMSYGILFSEGVVKAQGTASKHITFTSAKTPKTRGDWQGVAFRGSGSNGSLLDYCDISYAGMQIDLDTLGSKSASRAKASKPILVPVPDNRAALSIMTAPGTGEGTGLINTTLAIRHTNITESATGGVLVTYRGMPTFYQMNISKCVNWPVNLEDNAIPNFTGTLTLSDNGYNNDRRGICVSSRLDTDYSFLFRPTLTLPDLNHPWIFTTPLKVDAGDTLTIKAGADLRFAPNAKVTIYGRINALGEAGTNKQVTFGPWVRPYSYTWPGICFVNSPTNGADGKPNQMLYSIVTGATGGTALSSAGSSPVARDFVGAVSLWAYSAPCEPFFDHCRFAWNDVGMAAMGNAQCQPIITNCNFTSNLESGVVVRDLALPNFGDIAEPVSVNETGNNSFLGNEFFAIDFDNSANPGKKVFAENCWWGTTSKPAIKAMFKNSDWIGWAPALASPPVGLLTPARPVGSAQVVALAASPAKGGGAAIVYALSAPASVEASIVNLAGRVVNVLPTQSNDSGLQHLLWNGRSNMGTKVPGGRYFVSLRVRGDQGNQVQRLTSLTLR